MQNTQSTQKNKDLERADAEALIEDIYKFRKEKAPDLSIMETLIEYSFHYEIPLQELGNVISEHKIFVGILEKELAREKYIKLEEEEDNFDEEEW